VSDADAFKKAIQDMTTAVAPFTGRLAVDAEATCLGGTAAQHVVMIRFADAEQALFLRLKNLVVEPQDQGSPNVSKRRRSGRPDGEEAFGLARGGAVVVRPLSPSENF
jgi:hypothetical protein